MSTKRRYLLVLLILTACSRVGMANAQAVNPAVNATTETAPDPQFQLYREALLNAGSTEQMRLNAANLLLLSESPEARSILLAILKDAENVVARAAVCRTLSNARGTQKQVSKREDFIEPLMELLHTEEDVVMAQLAAQATLVFDYEQICDRLETIAGDDQLALRVRLNAIEALKRPDKGAIMQLIRLVDDPDRQVGAGAEHAVKSLGIPAGSNAEQRSAILDALEKTSAEEFLRDWVIRLEGRLRQTRSDLDWWSRELLSSLDNVYIRLKDNGEKADFLAANLASPKKVVKLWALKKVSEKRRSTDPELPEALGAAVVALISDPDRDVRLPTAQLLSLAGELNSAEQLLVQLEKEPYDDVRLELFVALGVTCKHDLLSAPDLRIPMAIRMRALDWAAKYLAESDQRKAREGAEVIKKLLEQNGLDSEQVNKYLELLAARYEQEKQEGDGTLRGELLGRIAGLCAQGSTCRLAAGKLFEPLFVQALGDSSELVREAAVDGLIYIDEAKALRLLSKAVVADPGLRIRVKLIELAGRAGSADDLNWLWEKVGTAEESGQAWDSMLKVFKRSQPTLLGKWIARLDTASGSGKLSDEQYLSFLEMAEQKAVSEDQAPILGQIRRRLADLHRKAGAYEQAAEYLGLLQESMKTQEEIDKILPDLLDVYLRWPNPASAASLIDNYLLRRDLGPESPVVVTIDRYLESPGPEKDPDAVIATVISQVKKVSNRPGWKAQITRWANRDGSAGSSDANQGNS